MDADLRTRLTAAATAVRQHAHAPYSGFAVGAALADEQGRVHVGCNVENAAYPQGLCAEAVALGCAGLIDHHESPRFIDGSLDVIADACDRFGMPAVVCYGATERNDCRDEARRGLAECARFARANRRPGVRVANGGRG